MTFLLGHGRANQSQKLAELEAELTALKFRVADLERRMHVSPELIAEIEEGARESKAWRKERERSHRDSETPSTTASTYDPLAVTYDPPSFTYDPPASPDPTPSTIDPGGGGSSGGGGADGSW